MADGFATQQQVLAHLQAAGWKVGKSALSNHVRGGLLKKRAGVFPVKAVERYAELHLQHKDRGVKKSDQRLDGLRERRLKAEVEEKEQRAAKARKEMEILDGRWMMRSDHVREMAAACAVLEQGLKHFFRLRAPELVAAVAGDQARQPDLVRALLAGIDERLAEFARPQRFDVAFDEFEEDEDNDEASQ